MWIFSTFPKKFPWATLGIGMQMHSFHNICVIIRWYYYRSECQIFDKHKHRLSDKSEIPYQIRIYIYLIYDYELEPGMPYPHRMRFRIRFSIDPHSACGSSRPACGTRIQKMRGYHGLSKKNFLNYFFKIEPANFLYSLPIWMSSSASERELVRLSNEVLKNFRGLGLTSSVIFAMIKLFLYLAIWLKFSGNKLGII